MLQHLYLTLFVPIKVSMCVFFAYTSAMSLLPLSAIISIVDPVETVVRTYVSRHFISIGLCACRRELLNAWIVKSGVHS